MRNLLKLVFVLCCAVTAYPQSQIDQFQILQLGQRASAPGNPPAGTAYIYFNASGTAVCVKSDGTSCFSGGGGSGTVTSIATSSPLGGGTITTTGTLTCSTCAIGPGSSSANHLAKFSGTDGVTLADGGAIPSGTVTSVGLAGTANQVTVTGTTPITSSGSWTLSLPAVLSIGTDNTTAGTLQMANGSSNAHTIWSSAATTSNTVAGPATVPTTGHLLDCSVSSTTCTLHDSGVVTANVVNASSPGAGIAHFAGSTQTVTSSAIVAADITSGTITGTQIASSVALAGSPTTTTQSAGDNSTKIATTAYVDGKFADFVSFCQQGIGASNATAYTLAPASVAGSLCSSASTDTAGVPITHACTIHAFYVKASAAGAVSGSGVAAVYKNTSVTTVTCTLGTGTTCNDTTHTATFAAGDTWSVRVTTGQGGDTTANIRASFQCY